MEMPPASLLDKECSVSIPQRCCGFTQHFPHSPRLHSSHQFQPTLLLKLALVHRNDESIRGPWPPRTEYVAEVARILSLSLILELVAVALCVSGTQYAESSNLSPVYAFGNLDDLKYPAKPLPYLVTVGKNCRLTSVNFDILNRL